MHVRLFPTAWKIYIDRIIMNKNAKRSISPKLLFYQRLILSGKYD